jgi:hypothetical protein
VNFAKRLQEFMNEQNRRGESFDAIDMTSGFLTQLAACAAVASVKSGEPPEAIIVAICETLRRTFYECRKIEQRRLS